MTTNENNKILGTIENRLWEQLSNQHSPRILAESLSFEDGLRVAYHLLYNDKWDSDLQKYALQLFNSIREIYSEKWNKNWEYDALLGLANYITLNYHERFEAYKRAFDKAQDPPPRLLIELARCCVCPGPPPISYEEAESLVVKALKDGPYSDGMSLLCNIYSLKNDKEKKDYWTNVLEKSDQEFESPLIEPKFLIEDYLKGKRIVEHKQTLSPQRGHDGQDN